MFFFCAYMWDFVNKRAKTSKKTECLQAIRAMRDTGGITCRFTAGETQW